MLSKMEFDLLVSVQENEGFYESDVKKTESNILYSLIRRGFVSEGKITNLGIEALEPYRVKRAIFIAAGFGSRLVPITLNTPKPLVRVKGKRIIDSMLDAVIAAGITEIYIVRGYLSEQFDQLLYKYPMIKFVENPLYNESNNISSAMCVKELFGEAYVLEGDLLLYNPKLITKYQYWSNYLGVSTRETDDWCFVTDENDIITKLQIGGVDCAHMFGISFWSKEDGIKLSKDMENAYNSLGGKELYWDQVALDKFADNYNIHVRECTFDDIKEIDTYRELIEVDETYKV